MTRSYIALLIVIGFILLALTGLGASTKKEIVGSGVADVVTEEHGVATFAGGCFWCMEPQIGRASWRERV